MGFGYGRGTSHSDTAYNYETGKRVAKGLGQNVAHVWAQQVQSFGQSGNGNFYFKDDTLYSYGTHYVVGLILKDGTTFLNADSNSVTTNAHRSDASGAVRGRSVCALPDLTDWRDLLRDLSKDIQGRVKAKLAANALALELASFGTQDRETWKRTDGELFGHWICRRVGLRATVWDKVLRDAKAAKVAAGKAKAKEALAERKRVAVRFGDMTAHELRQTMQSRISAWNYGRELQAIGTKVYHAKRDAKLFGLSAKRLANIRQREKELKARIEIAERVAAIATRRAELGKIVNYVRSWKNWTNAGTEAHLWSATTIRVMMDNLGRLSTFERVPESLRTYAMATRNALGQFMIDAQDREEAERVAQRESYRIECEKRDAERAEERAEYRRAWLAGEAVSGRYGSNFDADCGGAALRVWGDELQTSQGASVPLRHAIRVFQFVKLCRERGEGWTRNGVTIRVGHFQVDSVSANGDFIAGCHSIKWSEVERVAKIAGLFDVAPSADAVEPSREAA